MNEKEKFERRSAAAKKGHARRREATMKDKIFVADLTRDEGQMAPGNFELKPIPAGAQAILDECACHGHSSHVDMLAPGTWFHQTPPHYATPGASPAFRGAMLRYASQNVLMQRQPEVREQLRRNALFMRKRFLDMILYPEKYFGLAVAPPEVLALENNA
jgi:hypothetical protein